uniref:Serine peptidase inhibitor, Kunitz type 3 n=1 Tax=Molossus molossus TaxID=27622 RepID=A0A7J8HKK1_MOLMO|nr:serine peptidase inhibitor, Kunitz type 3 [Molossus molossus]
MQHRMSLPFLLLLTFGQELQSGVGTGQQNQHQNVSPEVCKLPIERGPCRAKLQRWFYNVKTHQCEIFYYGGCQGNGNNFLKKNICKKVCRNV